jgi:tetratricopeptide (TPR) repeat protein
MPRKLAGFMLAVCITITPSLAQTTTELLQKGIYTQETEGNLDNAILIYRQIVNSAPSQRDLAAQAQFRLAQALLQKGDLTSAAQEFDKLARDYSDYRNLVSSLSAQTSKRAELDRQAVEATYKFLYSPAPSALAGMTFDESKPVKVAGKVTRLTLSNPVSTMIVDGPVYHIFALASVLDMGKGFRKTSLGPGDKVKSILDPGDQVEVSGVLAAGGQNIDGSLAARADLVTFNGIIVFDRSKLVASTGQPYGNAVYARQAKLEVVQLQLAQLQMHLSSIQSTDSDNHPDIVKTKAQIAQLQAAVDALKKQVSNDGPAQ